jgi:hypothetical protein
MGESLLVEGTSSALEETTKLPSVRGEIQLQLLRFEG